MMENWNVMKRVSTCKSLVGTTTITQTTFFHVFSRHFPPGCAAFRGQHFPLHPSRLRGSSNIRRTRWDGAMLLRFHEFHYVGVPLFALGKMMIHKNTQNGTGIWYNVRQNPHVCCLMPHVWWPSNLWNPHPVVPANPSANPSCCSDRIKKSYCWRLSPWHSIKIPYKSH